MKSSISLWEQAGGFSGSACRPKFRPRGRRGVPEVAEPIPADGRSDDEQTISLPAP
jgi:hypothetical protein